MKMSSILEAVTLLFVAVNTCHYENLPMQYTEIFLALKIENFQLQIFDIFLIFAQNIDCGTCGTLLKT